MHNMFFGQEPEPLHFARNPNRSCNAPLEPESEQSKIFMVPHLCFYIPTWCLWWHAGVSFVRRSNPSFLRACPSPSVVMVFLVPGGNTTETLMPGVPRRAMSDGKITFMEHVPD